MEYKGEDIKVALGMIVRGTGEEPQRLRTALQSIFRYVDGIYITITGPKDQVAETEKICDEFNVHVSYTDALYTVEQETVDFLAKFFGYEPKMKAGDKIFMFDVARNFNLEQIPKDYQYMMWLDCDDTVEGAENLWKLKVIGKQAEIDAFYLNYVYQADFNPDGSVRNVVIEHLRERLVKTGDLYKWVAPIHETLIEQRPTRKTDNYDLYILHHAETKDRVASLERNLKNLELSIAQTKAKDPRPVYYLAKAYFDIATPEAYQRAIPLIKQYLYGENKSGWPEERGQACEYLSEIYRIQGDYAKSIHAALAALAENPESIGAYLDLAITYMLLKDWDRSLFWVKLASSIQPKKSTLVNNPRDIQARTLEVIYQCCVNKGEIDKAWAAASKLLELFPNEDYSKNNYYFINDLRIQRDITKEVVHLANELEKRDEKEKIIHLLNAVPLQVQNNPFIINLYQKYLPAREHENNEITIFCGPGFTPWSPAKMKNPEDTFVGGSEEAVICMSRELAKLGWKVTVYADPGNDAGVHDGVVWEPYYKFNRNDTHNILIAWRQLGFFDNNLKYKHGYVWNHDIQNHLEWTPQRYVKIEKAMFLSKWHRGNVPNLPEEKVFLTSNGL